MADFNSYKPGIKSLDYPTKYNAFVDAMETYATEIENAREGETNLLTNLGNYAKYTITQNFDGGAISGTATGASTTSLVDTGASFTSALNGLIVHNVTDGESSTVTYVNSTTLTTDTMTNAWTDKVYSIGGYKCTNMSSKDIANTSDYATVGYLNSLTAGTITEITQLSPGTLSANDTVAISGDGLSIVGRSNVMIAIDSTNDGLPVSYNEHYDFDVSVNFGVTLPAGVDGGQIEFSDVGGTVDATSILTITPATGESIMGQTVNEALQVKDYPYISFKLLYVAGSQNTWYITDLQR